MLFLLSLIPSFVNCATIAELVRARASTTLSKAAAAISQYPQWSAPGAITVFLPTDTALAESKYLPSGSVGAVMLDFALDHMVRPNYRVLQDSTKQITFIYDNYTPDSAVNPVIHIRTGTVDGLTVEQVKADNGWLYVLQKTIEPLQVPSIAIASQTERGTTQFLDLITRLNMKNYLDSLTGYTFFVPVDAAFRKVNLASYTDTQLKAIVLYHISPKTTPSTILAPGNVATGLEGQTVRLSVSASESNNYGVGTFVLADIFAKSGVIHLIDNINIPTTFPDKLDIPDPGSKADLPPTTDPKKPATNSQTSIIRGGIAFSIVVITIFLVW